MLIPISLSRDSGSAAVLRAFSLANTLFSSMELTSSLQLLFLPRHFRDLNLVPRISIFIPFSFLLTSSNPTESHKVEVLSPSIYHGIGSGQRLCALRRYAFCSQSRRMLCPTYVASNDFIRHTLTKIVNDCNPMSCRIVSSDDSLWSLDALSSSTSSSKRICLLSNINISRQ